MNEDRELLELAVLRSSLKYEPDTGHFYWMISNSNRVKIGQIAGNSLNSDGYKHIQINGKLYKAHRLAWFYVHGVWPDQIDQIDHINGNRSDNRIGNLRSVTVKMNNHNQRNAHSNSKSGVLGVIKKPSGKFAAEIRHNNKKIHIGTFDTAEKAGTAYKESKLRMQEGALP